MIETAKASVAKAMHRRRSDPDGQWWITRTWIAATTPVRDKPGMSLSLTKLLAIYFAAFLWHVVETKHDFTGTQLGLALAIFAVAFGKSTFTFFLKRNEFRTAIAQADVHVETVHRDVKEIIERRDPDAGIEPTP